MSRSLIRTLTFRQIAATVVAAVGVEAVFSAATPDRPAGQRILSHIPQALPWGAHLLALVVGLALVVLAPKLWRGTRTAASLTIGGLIALAVLNVVKGLDLDETALDLCLAALLWIGRGAFPLGCRKRPQLAVLVAAVGAWALSYCALLTGPLVSDHGRTLGQAVRDSLGQPHLTGLWVSIVEAFIACAIAVSLLAIRSLLKPAVGGRGHRADEYRVARAAVERDGADSLAPFILRPDKAFHFHRGAVVAYRVFGETAVVSGDPVGPEESVAGAIASFRELARSRGWHTVLWGASDRHITAYRAAGLRAVCAGEEAFIDPAGFTLDGRRVRKLRQSVHRLDRRGWQITAREGRSLDLATEAEMDALEARWRAQRARITGFAMGTGVYEPVRRPADLYMLARSPGGELRAVMRFAAYAGGLSLDTMRRVGETPNGLNEALVCTALELARDRGVREVSLNYAGLAHIVRDEFGGGRIVRYLARTAVRLLGPRFQMARLVQFDEKFFPEWRRRYLVCETTAMLPRAIMRALQAEGYLPEAPRPRLPHRWRPAPPALPRAPRTDVAG